MELAVMNEPQGMVSITHSFGTITVPEDAILSFPTGGLFGFEKVTQYALLPAARDGLWWLMSPTSPPTTFVLADPFVVDPGYVVDLGDREKEALQIASPDEVLVLVMLSLPPEGSGTTTGNMRAPLVINLARRLASQIVSRDDAHSMQTVVDLARYALADGTTQLG